jgi:hypothetical protein
MRKKFTKKEIMNKYYSDDELKEMARESARGAMNWLEEANRFMRRILPKKTKILQQKLIKEGW